MTYYFQDAIKTLQLYRREFKGQSDYTLEKIEGLDRAISALKAAGPAKGKRAKPYTEPDYVVKLMGEPYLHDRGDMVKGHFCIARLTGDLPGTPTAEYWNEEGQEGKWCAFGSLYIGRKAALAKLREIKSLQ